MSGCTPEPEITRRKVPKQAVPAVVTVEKIDGRMLAAIVPVGGQGWFFKLSGADEAVASEQENFSGLLKSLKIEDGKPVWQTPSDWSEKPASGMRAATFEVAAGDAKLECSVIPLPAEEPGSDDHLLSNINRWRGQLELEHQTIDELKESDSFEQFDLEDGTTVSWVNLAGKLAAGGNGPMSGRAPFAGGNAPFAGGGSASGPKAGPAAGPSLPPGHPPTAGAGPVTGPGADAAGDSPGSIPEMSFDVPGGWVAGRLKPFRKISWNVTHDGMTAEFYISSLSAAGSAVGPNVNRWRTQAGLKPLGDAELSDELEDISIGGLPGKLVEISGDKQSIIGAIVVKGDTGWFFKMVGDEGVVSGEKDRVTAFLKSVKFQ